MPPEQDKINQDGSISEQLAQARRQAEGIQDALNSRAEQQPESGSSVSDAVAGGNNEFFTALQDRLLNSSGMVSSSDNDLESSINRAVDEIGVSQEAGAEAIRSRFERSIRNAQQGGQRTADVQRESTGGFATNLAALREVSRQTDQRIGDLEQQREQFLLQNRSDAADRITDVITQERQLEQQARQNMLSNLLQAGRLRQSAQQQQMQQTQFEAQQDRLQGAQDFSEASQRIQFLSDNGLLDNASEEDLSALENQYGIPQGTIKNIKEQPGELNLRTISGVGLVNITQDENGNPQTKVIVPERKTSSGEDEEDPVFTFNSTDIKEITSAGLPPAVIPGLQRNINTFGLETALENSKIQGRNLTDAEKKAIRDTLKPSSNSSGIFSGGIQPGQSRVPQSAQPGVEE